MTATNHSNEAKCWAPTGASAWNKKPAALRRLSSKLWPIWMSRSKSTSGLSNQFVRVAAVSWIRWSWSHSSLWGDAERWNWLCWVLLLLSGDSVGSWWQHRGADERLQGFFFLTRQTLSHCVILPLYLSVHREAQTEIGFDGQHSIYTELLVWMSVWPKGHYWYFLSYFSLFAMSLYFKVYFSILFRSLLVSFYFYTLHIQYKV